MDGGACARADRSSCLLPLPIKYYLAERAQWQYTEEEIRHYLRLRQIKGVHSVSMSSSSASASSSSPVAARTVRSISIQKSEIRFALKQRASMISWAVLLLVITAICTLLYYLNYPVAETAADTPGYLDVVRQLQRYGSPVHPFRLPIYPLF